MGIFLSDYRPQLRGLTERIRVSLHSRWRFHQSRTRYKCFLMRENKGIDAPPRKARLANCINNHQEIKTRKTHLGHAFQLEKENHNKYHEAKIKKSYFEPNISLTY